VCRLCGDVAQDALESRCHHVFCRLCIQEYMESYSGDEDTQTCPVCHVLLSVDLTAPALEVDDEDMGKKGSIINRIDMTKWRSSTKIEALVEELSKLRAEDHTIKSLVFSQFTSFLDLIEWRLQNAGYHCVKLQGSMSPTQREATIKYFMTNPGCTVFLVSLKAGGVALNLTEASRVFLMDCWWNPGTEMQASDRVHRIGQARAVVIKRLVVENSIEERIIQLQKKKESMVAATIDQDDSSLQRLSQEDFSFLFQN